MCDLTTTTIVGGLDMIKKGIDKHINNLLIPDYMKYKKLHFEEQLISWEEYHQCEWKILPRRDSKNINTYNVHKHYLS